MSRVPTPYRAEASLPSLIRRPYIISPLSFSSVVSPILPAGTVPKLSPRLAYSFLRNQLRQQLIILPGTWSQYFICTFI